MSFFKKKVMNLGFRSDGFTLLEVLLVVGVGAVLILAGLGTYQLVTDGSKTNDANRLLSSIKQKVQTAYQGQTTYGTGNLTASLVTMGIFPDQYLDSANNPVHPWNGPLLVVGTAGGAQFTITFTGLDDDECAHVAIFTMDEDPDFATIQYGSSAALAAVPTPTQAAAACNGGENGNSVAWSFF